MYVLFLLKYNFNQKEDIKIWNLEGSFQKQHFILLKNHCFKNIVMSCNISKDIKIKEELFRICEKIV